MQRMIDAGEPEENIATVIQGYKAPEGDSGALATAGTRAGLPFVRMAAEELASNPAVKRAGSVIGQVAGGYAGMKTGNPLNVAGGIWGGGRAGWHTGSLLQRLASPVANTISRLEPYVSPALGAVSGAQGVGDLAQMADPQRKDIGFLGVGATGKSDPEHPALLNLILQKLRIQ